MAKLFIEDTSLVAIADAIREKTGGVETMTPAEMATAIQELETGAGLPEDLTYWTGSCAYKFYGDSSWNWVPEKFGNQIITENINTINNICKDNKYLTSFPIDFNFHEGTTSSTEAFYNCNALTEIGNFNNFRPISLSYMFCNCYRLRNLPENFGDNWDWSFIHTFGASTVFDYMFRGCYSLRSIPNSLLKNLWGSTKPEYTLSFYECFSMDEIKDFPVKNNGGSFLPPKGRLKEFTFETNEDGTPKTVEWSGKYFNFNMAGYAVDNSDKITDYNSGITKDKLVITAEAYAALKDDPDWYSTSHYYSRYNHDSAVNTINSLPDASAYITANSADTNTIRFEGVEGSLTDGGAIETLTESEIAVATAKGWTVTLA